MSKDSSGKGSDSPVESVMRSGSMPFAANSFSRRHVPLAETHTARLHAVAIGTEDCNACSEVRAVARTDVEQLLPSNWYVFVKLPRTLDAPGEIEKISREGPPVHLGNWLEERAHRLDCNFEYLRWHMQRCVADTNRSFMTRFHTAPST